MAEVCRDYLLEAGFPSSEAWALSPVGNAQ